MHCHLSSIYQIFLNSSFPLMEATKLETNSRIWANSCGKYIPCNLQALKLSNYKEVKMQELILALTKLW